MAKQKIDYSLYLVTDSTPAILGARDLADVVESSLQGGVTIVQYRDKTSSHSDCVGMARRLHGITTRYGVPLLINDRVDVAVEIGCEGVHIGQDDMAYEEARRLLGPDKIIGVTANTEEEALKAAHAGADYLGIGTVYATDTKKDTKSIIGPSGVRSILTSLLQSQQTPSLPTVCIGGINASNVSSVLAQSRHPQKPLDGVAVVSAIVAAPDPAAASRDLLAKVLVQRVPGVVQRVAELGVLSHNMTNLVVQNFAANVALAVGASPIMANYAEEAADLARLGGALVVNMGTVTPEGLRSFQQAIKAYNDAGRPVLLDPVGAGATSVRRAAVKTLLSSGRFTLIKGNEGEISTLAGSTLQQKGVDSTSSLSVAQRASLCASLARALSCVILMTGRTDVLSDGKRTLAVDNGHEYLGMVTGTGCTLGTTVSAMLAAAVATTKGEGGEESGHGDALLAAMSGVVMFTVAAEMAAERPEVRGPGTFVPAFLDELYSIRKATARGDLRWLALIKVKVIASGET